jgi:hypothetical protein
MDLSSVEETMTEVRRNWNVMLQDQVNAISESLMLVQPDYGGIGDAAGRESCP